MKTPNSPLEYWYTTGALSTGRPRPPGLPSVAQSDQTAAPGEVWRICQRPASAPQTKTSSRPVLLRATAILLARTPPSVAHADQADRSEREVCHRCQRALSVPRTNTSSLPSAFRATTGSPVSIPPRETQSPILGGEGES